MDGKLQHRAIAVNEKKAEARKRMQRAFAGLLEPKELLVISAQTKMALRANSDDELFSQLGAEKECRMKQIAFLRANSNAERLIGNLERSADEFNLEIDIAYLSKEDCRELPGFRRFLNECIIRRFTGLKVTDAKGDKKTPLLFSPNRVLFSSSEGDVYVLIYDEKTDFSRVFRMLSLR